MTPERGRITHAASVLGNQGRHLERGERAQVSLSRHDRAVRHRPLGMKQYDVAAGWNSAKHEDL